MKISTFIGILVVIGVIFFVFASMVNESNSYYGTSIDSENLTGKYDYASSINSSIDPIRKSLETIESEDTGWFTKITAGIAAIPRAVTLLPVMLYSAFSIGGSMITGFFTTLGIPNYILTVALILVLVWGVFKLIEVFQRWQV